MEGKLRPEKETHRQVEQVRRRMKFVLCFVCMYVCLFVCIFVCLFV